MVQFLTKLFTASTVEVSPAKMGPPESPKQVPTRSPPMLEAS